MNAVPHERGLALLVAHCASLDLDSPTARERLAETLGSVLAEKLVFALSSGTRSRERSRSDLAACFVFAA
jgi:ubiquinone biosynthesis protein UbiJ